MAGLPCLEAVLLLYLEAVHLVATCLAGLVLPEMVAVLSLEEVSLDDGHETWVELKWKFAGVAPVGSLLALMVRLVVFLDLDLSFQCLLVQLPVS